MRLPFQIRLSKALAFLPHPKGERRSSAWLHEAVVEAAHAVSDRLGEVEQLRETAVQIHARVNELEWSWRRLDLSPPSHPDDEDLARQVRITQDEALRDLQCCCLLVEQAHGELSSMLGIGASDLRDIQLKASAAVELIFTRPHDPAQKLDDLDVIALLAVVCDAVAHPKGQLIEPILSAAFAEHLVRPGIVPEPKHDDSAADSHEKSLVRDGKPIKLMIEESDLAVIESLVFRLGLRKNQFAIRAVASRIRGEDPLNELKYFALRQLVVALEALLHTALACHVAARHGQMVCPRTHDHLESIIRSARHIRRECTLLLQLTAGAAVRVCPAFLRAIKQLRGRTKALTETSGNCARTGEVAAILRYLAVLRIIP